MEYARIPLEPVFDVSFLTNISYYKLAPDFLNLGETHDFWELLYVDRGSVIITAGDDTYLLKAGEMVFHRPKEFHALRSAEQSDIIVVSFGCESNAMHRLERKIIRLHSREKAHLKLLIEEAQQVFVYFENEPAMVDLSKKDTAPFGCDHLIKTYLEQFLIYVCRRDDNILFNQRAVLAEPLHQNLVIAQQAIDYLAENYRRKVSLASVAAALEISVPQLKRMFREQIGQSMVHYLISLRISEAKRLIRQGDRNFTQIAEQVGYETIYYFSRQFKQHTGMTPSEYAKSIKS